MSFVHLILIVDGEEVDPLVDGLEAEETERCGWSEVESEDAYESEDSDALSGDAGEGRRRGDSEEGGDSLVCRIPTYFEARIANLRQLEALAQTGLGNAVSQLDRLVQLYTEINEVRECGRQGERVPSFSQPIDNHSFLCV